MTIFPRYWRGVFQFTGLSQFRHLRLSIQFEWSEFNVLPYKLQLLAEVQQVKRSSNFFDFIVDTLTILCIACLHDPGPHSRMSKRSSSSSTRGASTSIPLCDGCQKLFKRIQVHLNHNPACNSIYTSRKTTLLDPNACIGGAVISSALVKAVQYHTSLSSLTVRGVRTDQQSRSRHRFPAPFEFVAQNAGAGAAFVEVAVDELDQHEMDDVNAFGEVESVSHAATIAGGNRSRCECNGRT